MHTKETTEALGPGAKPSDFSDEEVDTPEFQPYGDDVSPVEPKMPEADDYAEEVFDKYIGAEVNLPLGEAMRNARVVNRKRDSDGNPIGRSHTNPLLDTRQYKVEFPDGTEQEYAANIIAESMYAQCDSEGNQWLLMDSIVDHSKDGSAVSLDDLHIVVNGQKKVRKTTKGWRLCVLWKDGTTSWEALKDLKESNPVEVAEYAVANQIVTEAAFTWWVPYTLKKRARIIAAVNNRYHKRTHKFGLPLPKSLAEAHRIDQDSGLMLWDHAINVEMRDVAVAFDIKEVGEVAPVGYDFIPCHFVFDIKMENFRRKARYVAGGHVTNPPAAATYASVVSRESVRIALVAAALNDLDILTADVQNAYLCAPITEKV